LTPIIPAGPAEALYDLSGSLEQPAEETAPKLSRA